MKRFALVLLVFALLIPGLAALAQDGGDNVDALVDVAIGQLGEQLGLTLTRSDFARWTWQEKFFDDASMGCPQPDQVYAQVLTRGFIILLEYQGAVYEFHVAADSSAATFCGSEAAPPTLPAAQVTATGEAAPPAATTPSAATPVAATPTPIEDDPEALVDVGVAYLNAQLNLNATRRNFANWTWQETVWPDTALGCPQPDQTYDDTTPVRGYVINLVYGETTYELHMTPDGRTIMPCGNDQLTPLLNGSPLTATPGETAGQALAALTAYTGPDGNVYLTTGDDYPGIQVTKDVTDTTPGAPEGPTWDHLYGLFRWSPDSAHLAFVDSSHPYRLLLTDNQGSLPLVLAEALTVAYPVAWSASGDEIAYVTPTQTFREGNKQVMEIHAVSLAADGTVGEARLVTTFEQGVGCGGGSSDPADWRYSTEAGYMGNQLSLFWLLNGDFLVSTSCDGVGLSRVTVASGETTVLDAQLARTALSPDQSRAAGIAFDAERNKQLVVVDLINGGRQILALNATPDQVGWSADGARLYVSTVDPSDTWADPVDQNTYQFYTVRLWELALPAVEPTLIFEQDGRGIGQIVASGDGLIFSFVENSRRWFEARAANADLATLREAAPAIWLLVVDASNQATRLGLGRSPAPQPVLPDEVG